VVIFLLLSTINFAQWQAGRVVTRQFLVLKNIKFKHRSWV